MMPEERAGKSTLKTRNGFKSVEAIDHADGGRKTVFLGIDHLKVIAQRTPGQVRELAYVVPWVLTHPTAIFVGIRDGIDEDEKDDWLCYCSIPPFAYWSQTGHRKEPWSNEVFCVYVTTNDVIYTWRWENCEQDDAKFPKDWESRFRKRVL